jgi:hypothetical protein
VNWLYIAANALWIFALAWAVALGGSAYWESLDKKEPLRTVWAQPQQSRSINLVLIAFSSGLGLVTSPVWGKVLWFGLAIVALFQVLKPFLLRNKKDRHFPS